jgi:hypothetical protein
MHIFQRVKKLWELTDNTYQGIVMPNGSEAVKDSSEPFVVFPCAECKQDVIINATVYPGQVAVVNCSNCHTSMSVYCPQLVIRMTKDLPDDVGASIWKELSA